MNHIPQESHTDIRKEMEGFQLNLFTGFIMQKFRDANKPIFNRLYKSATCVCASKLEYNQES